MMPTALWLGTREYSGVWLHGGERGRFSEREVFGFLGDGRMAVLSEATRRYGSEHDGSRVLSPPWYRDRFVHWAIGFIHFWSRYRGDFVLERSRPGQGDVWCGVEGCPSPYVTIVQVAPVAFHRLDPSVGRESSEANGELSRAIRPHWGAFLTGERMAARRQNRDGGGTEEEGVWSNGSGQVS